MCCAQPLPFSREFWETLVLTPAMQCPECKRNVPDEQLELCPHCGTPLIFASESPEAPLSANTVPDLRLKELIEDVKKSLEQLPGEAEATGNDRSEPELTARAPELYASNQKEPPETDSQQQEEDLRACELEAETLQPHTPEQEEELSQEKLPEVMSALDQVLPPEPAQPAVKRKKKNVMLGSLAAAVFAALLLYATGSHKSFQSLFAPAPPKASVPMHSPQRLPEIHQQKQPDQAPHPSTLAAKETLFPIAQLPSPADNRTDAAAQIRTEPEQASAEHPSASPDNAASLQQMSPLQPSAEQPPEPKKYFTIHTDSYRSQEKALQESARLQKLGSDAFVQEFEHADKGRWYRVMVGKFKSLQEARAALDAVRQTLEKNDARIVSLDRTTKLSPNSTD